MTETADKKAIVKRDGQRDLKFDYKWVATASSTSHSAFRWTELRLYLTTAGKYVIDSRGITCVDGEHDRFEGYVCASTEEVIKKLTEINEGYLGSLSKELLDNAEIDYAEEI